MNEYGLAWAIHPVKRVPIHSDGFLCRGVVFVGKPVLSPEEEFKSKVLLSFMSSMISMTT